jgi:hypothetical protein
MCDLLLPPRFESCRCEKTDRWEFRWQNGDGSEHPSQGVVNRSNVPFRGICEIRYPVSPTSILWFWKITHDPITDVIPRM